MKRKHYSRRVVAGMMAAMLALTTVPTSALARTAADYVTSGVNAELTVPFGIVSEYIETKGIRVVWGAAGYSTYTITISGKTTDYTRTYTSQEFREQFYDDAYTPGETYFVSIQGEQDGELSNPGVAEVTIPGTAGPSTPTDPAEDGDTDIIPEENGVNLTEIGNWVFDLNNGGVATKTDNADGSASIKIDEVGTQLYAVQYTHGLEMVEGKTYQVRMDLLSDKDATVNINLQEQVNWSSIIPDDKLTVELKAGEVYHYSVTTNPAGANFVKLGKLAIMFGNVADNAGATVKVSNVNVYGQSSHVDEAPGEEETPIEDKSGINFDEIDHSVDYIDGGTDVSVVYSGNKITAAGADWGNDWGADSHWQIQLKEVINVDTVPSLYDVKFKVKSDVARDIKVKLGDLNNDAATYYFETITLAAGTNTISFTSTSEVEISNLMVLFALGTSWGSEQNELVISNLTVEPHREDGVKEGAIDLEAAETELYVGSDWAGASVTVNEAKTVANLNAANYGWGNEWAVQYMVKNLGLAANTEYTLSADITSSIDKYIMVKLDDSGVIVDTILLKAGETYEYTNTATTGDSLNNQILYFAAGMMGSVSEAPNLAGNLTIENVRIKDADGNYIVLGGGATGTKGPEYDFNAEDNYLYDYADPGTSKDGYDLIWADEFNGNYDTANVDANGLNLDNWAYQLGDGSTDCGNYGWGNQELQCYTANSTNVGVNEDLNDDGNPEGVLRITANNEQNGYKYANESSKKYTSARLRTTKPGQELFNLTYGYVEARISLPQTQGAWPAFWMLPESTEIYGNWPVSGEIDILETTGLQANQACSTVHRGVPTHVYKGSGYVKLNSEIRYFHTYAINWEPGKMEFLYDGQVIYTAENWESAIAGASDSLSYDAPFDQPFYMILNLAVDSGNFGGAANAANFTGDINMYVDYVRAYQKSEGYPETATKTAGTGAKEDWSEHAGVNQISNISEDTLVVLHNALVDDDAKGTGNWYVANQSDADGEGSIVTNDNGTFAKIDVTKAGSQDYGVQFIGHYDAKDGYTYKVSFDAYAEGGFVGKQFACSSKEYKSWGTYGVKQFTVKDTPTHYEFTFQQEEDFDNCRIEYNIGAQGTGTVYIGNVKVEIVSPEGDDEGGARSPLGDGNLVYNGTFDQGVNHIGYWTAGANTTVSVPRYTTEKLADSDVKVVDVASKTNYEHIADGIKYYVRRAQISAPAGKAAVVYQPGMSMTADTFSLSFDMYSKTDSAVKAAICEMNADGTYGREIATATTSYSAANGVKKYTLALTTDEDVVNGALVLAFAKDTAVQIDNVKMYGTHQDTGVDENPLKGDENGGWTADDAAGNTLPVTFENGVYTVTGITSGSTWYSPQCGSKGFPLVSGLNYKLSFKFKLEGTTNGTLEYIVQEANSWTIAKQVTKVDSAELTVDEDGFYVYEVEFVSEASVSGARVNFGFGNSAAQNATFMFKDVDVTLVKAAAGGANDNSDVDGDQFVDTPEEPVVVPATPVEPAKPTLGPVAQKVQKVVEKIVKTEAKVVKTVVKTVKKVEKAVTKLVKIIGSIFK